MAKKSDVAFDLSGYRPEVILSGDLKHWIIRCERVDHHPEGARLSGQYIHLGLTTADALRLLVLLQHYQKKHGFPVPDTPVSVTYVPPVKDRN